MTHGRCILKVFLTCLMIQSGSSSQNHSLSPSSSTSFSHINTFVGNAVSPVTPVVMNAVSATKNTAVSPLPSSFNSSASFAPVNTFVGNVSPVTSVGAMNINSAANTTAVSPLPSPSFTSPSSPGLGNYTSGNISMVNDTPVVMNISSGVTNATVDVNISSSLSNISSSLSKWTRPTVSITSQISGDTSTYNNTFFIEFKMDTSHWSAALTTKHNAYINKANTITTTIDHIYMNDSTYEGSYVLGFRQGVYVSIKVKFNRQASLYSLDNLIRFFRSGGGTFRTDKVFIKLSQHANCIINYVDTKLCDCQSMTYKRQITCQQPDVFGGEGCPEKCRVGDMIVGTTACSWDDLDAFKCYACLNRPVVFLLVFSVLANFW